MAHLDDSALRALHDGWPRCRFCCLKSRLDVRLRPDQPWHKLHLRPPQLSKHARLPRVTTEGPICEVIGCSRAVDRSGRRLCYVCCRRSELLAPVSSFSRISCPSSMGVKVAQVVSVFASRLVRSTPAAPNLESLENFVEAADIRLCFIMSPAHSKTTFPSRSPISWSRAWVSMSLALGREDQGSSGVASCWFCSVGPRARISGDSGGVGKGSSLGISTTSSAL